MIKKWLMSVTLLVAVVSFALPLCAAESTAKLIHKPMKNDPLGVEIYQLENGLTVYFSVNKDAPRIHTFIGTRTGAVDEPSDKSGLAHYLEHLLFKGSEKIGTLDYEKEKDILEQISDLYAKHENETAPEKREAIYKEIDRLSGEAAKYGIPNEFVLALRQMGARNINAFTSYNYTTYVCSIPSNQLKKWLALEVDRFASPVFRIFHTELETVYEEFNMSLDKPARRIWYFIYEHLYKGHPRSRPVLGLAKHLKNPSPRSVMDFYREFYVPNNMAIILAGDFDPKEALAEIEATFGKFKAKEFKRPVHKIPEPIKGEVVKEITLPEQESAMAIWRIEKTDQATEDMIYMLAKVLSNGSAGILDQEITLPQKALAAYCYGGVDRNLFGTLTVGGAPKTGDTPEQMLKMLDDAVEKLKNGDFPDWLPEAIVRQYKLGEIRVTESNELRADKMLYAYFDYENWTDVVNAADRLAKITKADIQAFAKQYLTKDRMVVYRRNGEMTPGEKLPKPVVTPVEINRTSSDFFKEIAAMPVKEISPVFPDMAKDVIKDEVTLSKSLPYADTAIDVYRNVPVMAVDNDRNDFFSIQFVYDIGSLNDKALSMIGSYSSVAGTEKRTIEELKEDLFRLAGGIGVSVGGEETILGVSGLHADMDALLELAQTYINEPRENPEALKSLVERLLQSRKVTKEKPEDVLMTGLFNYVRFGKDNPVLYAFSEAELRELEAKQLTALLKTLKRYPCRVRYYGPKAKEIVAKVKSLADGGKFFTMPVDRATPRHRFVEAPVKREVVFVHMPGLLQTQMVFYKTLSPLNADDIGVRNLYNSYFGGGMSSVVFQRLRESNSLCYSCYALIRTSEDPVVLPYFTTYLTTQANKLAEAIQAVQTLGFPVSVGGIETAKEQLLRSTASERLYGANLLSLAETYRKMGRPDNYRETTYRRIQETAPVDLETFYRTQIKPGPEVLMLIGDEKVVDMDVLKQYGPVRRLSVDELFPQ